MMSKHTQGEWIARPDPSGSVNDWCIGLNDDVSPVDLVAVCHERDARLIAAAPDLLRAAQQAEADMAWAEAAVHGTNFQSALILLRAAIAKATGEAP